MTRPQIANAARDLPLLLDNDIVRRHLALDALLPAIEQALIELSAGRVLQPLRTVLELPGPGSLLFVKPAFVGPRRGVPDGQSHGGALATKLITQVPGNAARGLPTMIATLLLLDAQTGVPLAVMDATWLTELRTAAVSAVATRALRDREPKRLAILGSGALARSHALALATVVPLADIRVWSPTRANAERCAADIDGHACADAEGAVREADIVVTVTNASTPVLLGRWLKPGALVHAVGAPRPGWRELDDEAMGNYLIADQRQAAETESGDVILSGAKVQCEIGEVLAGKVQVPEGVTVIFKALGQAVEDAVAAQLVYASVIAGGI
ncbi:ornithine cyclodeaminase family protein [Sulfuritalea sp.]|uniref:ornithine cyclodeaminase family protein n=1 Tax=Sulfuritalea sp. TaxID=2480090 RepID=UPI00286DC898|nr:ornithine cyclodeaminase family protein [Sulfuritalea sp.]